MKKSNLVFLLVVFSIIALNIETTIIGFPIIFFLCATILALSKKTSVYILIFLLAITLDSLRVTHFGLTPLFLLSTILIIKFYEKFSGSNDLLIAIIIIAMFGFIYTHFMFYSLTLTIAFYIILISLFVGYQILKSKTKLFI